MSYICDMDLCEEACSPTTKARKRSAWAQAMKRYVILANALSDILSTLQKYHGFICLHRIIYMATLKLG